MKRLLQIKQNMSLEKKLNNLMTTYKKQINDLSRESKIVSGQRLIKVWEIDIVFLMMQNIALMMDHKITSTI